MGQISSGHPGVIRADIPAQNFGQGAQNPGKKNKQPKNFGLNYHSLAWGRASLETFLIDEQNWLKIRADTVMRVFLDFHQDCERVDPVQGSKSTKSGKEGFGVKKLPFPSAPEKVLSQKIPISTRKMVIFDSKRPCLVHWEMGAFRPETLFSRFCGF